MNIDEPMEFCKFFKSIVKKINNKISSRTRCITFKDILYCCLYMNGNSFSYSMTNINMYINNIIDVSDVALIEKGIQLVLLISKK